MGQTSADTQREIESLRDELSATVAELERRARRVVDWRAQAQEHPAALSVVGLGLLAGVAVLAYNAVSEYRESRKPINRAKRRAGSMAGEVRDRWGRAREAMPVQVSRRNRDGNREDESVDTTAQEPGMIKKVLWAGLTAGVIALFGLLARRASSALWQMIMKEPPPTAKV
jgi:hypothetical protein